MRVLGEVVKVTRSRNFLVKLRSPVRTDLKDMRVVSEDLTLVGVVSDVIGPVHEPYALVKVVIPLSEASGLVGKRLYVIEDRGEMRFIKYPGSSRSSR